MKRREKMKRHLTSLILTVVLVVGGVNVIPAGTKDVITTSSSIPDSFTGESANEVQGWTGLF